MPPLTGVAVKVALAPLQIEAELAAMLTAGVTLLTVMVAAFEVAVGVVAHDAF